MARKGGKVVASSMQEVVSVTHGKSHVIWELRRAILTNGQSHCAVPIRSISNLARFDFVCNVPSAIPISYPVSIQSHTLLHHQLQ